MSKVSRARIIKRAMNRGKSALNARQLRIPDCACFAPDFIGYAGEPEHWRCLKCGRHPNPAEQIRVQLFKRQASPVSPTGVLTLEALLKDMRQDAYPPDKVLVSGEQVYRWTTRIEAVIGVLKEVGP